MKIGATLLVILLGSMVPAIALGKEHSLKAYMTSLITTESKMVNLEANWRNERFGASHLGEQQEPIDVPELDRALVDKNCKFPDFQTQTQCFVNHVGKTVSDDEVKKFNSIADSKFTRSFVGQKLLSKFLPEDQLDAHVPEYFTIYSGRAASTSASVIEDIKKCEKGFVFHWFDSSDISNDANGIFKHYGQFFAADCKDKARIVVNFFEGYRRGFYKDSQESDENKEFVKSYCRETMIYMVSRHFGLAKGTTQ